MVGDDYGVRWLPTHAEGDGGGASPLDAYHPAAERLEPHRRLFRGWRCGA